MREGRKGEEAEGRKGAEPQLSDQVMAAAEGYHQPPSVPREEIWARIQAARRGASAGQAGDIPSAAAPLRPSAPSPFRPFASHWLRYATGIAALIALGIGIGRLTVLRQSGATGSAAPSMTALKDREKVAYSVATAEHLSKVETLLTSLRTTPDQTEFVGQARDLLTSTRLLLDSPGAADPRIRSLLQDLELILVQVVQLDPAHSREDLDLITDGLEQRQVMPRLRTAIPAGPARQL
jgi:hypothetical protein